MYAYVSGGFCKICDANTSFHITNVAKYIMLTRYLFVKTHYKSRISIRCACTISASADQENTVKYPS